jgi:uncharacterized protein (TIGR02145 family)
MNKELFNGSLETDDFNNDDRIAVGKPNVEGSKTMLWSRFKVLVQSWITGVSQIFTDETLTGDGTEENPLSVVDSGSEFDLAYAINDANEKLTLVDADTFAITDSEESATLKRTYFSIIKSTLKTYFDAIYQAAGATGDMILAGVQSVTGLKTFDKDKIAMKGTSTGKNTISVANTSASDYTNTIPAKSGTFAMTSDVVSFRKIKYGRLYNFPAINNANFAPVGWHVPIRDEWNTLGSGNGGAVKEIGLTYWNTPNEGATNSLFFNAKGNGYRAKAGSFSSKKVYAYLGTKSTTGIYYYNGFLSYYNADLTSTFNDKGDGLGVRFVKDDSVNPGSLTDVDGNVYRTVKIGSKVWLADNWACTKLNDGTPIANLTDNSAWNADSAGAYCDYDNDITNVFEDVNAESDPIFMQWLQSVYVPFDIASTSHAATAKGSFADNDEIPIVDSESSNALRKNLWSVVKSSLKTYFDGLYVAVVAGSRLITSAESTLLGNTSGTNSGNETATSIGTINHATSAKGSFVDNDEIPIIDSEASNVLKKNLWSVMKSTLKTYFDGLYATITKTIGYTTTATAAGTTTLDVNSNKNQFFTGSNIQTIIMPVTNTLTLGRQFIIRNLSTYAGLSLTIQASDTSQIIQTGRCETIILTCIDVSGTTNAAWDVTRENAAVEYILIPSGDLTTACTPGTTKAFTFLNFNFKLLAVYGYLGTVCTGSTFIFDINNGANSFLTTKLSIDASENTSGTAASAATINATYEDYTANTIITIDFDQTGATIAGAGPGVILKVKRT